MKTDELRDKYLDFFGGKGCTVVPSDVLVPKWDPSVLFTPAGMNQFKDHFLGRVKLDYTRAASCQKCLRTGDIDNVGRTAYHHTFFEMLGNFSFGDYFKREAISWAWEFLTDKKWLGLDQNRLTVTAYLDDDEAVGFWQTDVGLPLSRITRMGEDDNFWPAGAPTGGPDGVCGPCSEIFYRDDAGKDVEIWNLVFTQFNRVGDPPNNLQPLPSRNIDTGMGLERCASVLQNVTTNYHIDILRPIVEAARAACETKYVPTDDTGRRIRRIADHVRACTFAIHENVRPGNEKEKYVIRKLLRRAILDGYQLGRRDAFLHELVPVVVEMMKGPYGELSETADRVARTIRTEEQSYFHKLDDWVGRIEKLLSGKPTGGVIEGEEAGTLHATYGVHPEFVESMALDRGLVFDWNGYRDYMKVHGEASGAGQVALFVDGPIENLKKAVGSTSFVGYEKTDLTATIRGLVEKVIDPGRNETDTDDANREMLVPAEQLAVGAEDEHVAGIVVLDATPFYAEAGGQVGDSGALVTDTGRFVVTDTQKTGDLYLHQGYIESGHISSGQSVQAAVDMTRRDAIQRAHSATHVLHHALQQTLGGDAHQQGSKVEADLFRFDFAHDRSVGADELLTIEKQVNAKIAESAPVEAKLMPLEQARKLGAMMLFGEKYPDPVRVVSMGTFSKEFCGGTHLTNVGQIGRFEVLAEESVSAGTRRVTALTGRRAEDHAQQTTAALDKTATLLGVTPEGVPNAAAALSQDVRDLKKQLSGKGAGAPPKAFDTPATGSNDYLSRRDRLRETARLLTVPPLEVPTRIEALLAEKAKLTQQVEALTSSGTMSADDLLAQGTTIGGVTVIVTETPGANANLMRQWVNDLKKSKQPFAALLAATEGDKVTLLAACGPEAQKQGLTAGDWVRQVATVLGGSGGGKPDMAQAGGKDPSKLSEAIATATRLATAALAK